MTIYLNPHLEEDAIDPNERFAQGDAIREVATSRIFTFLGGYVDDTPCGPGGWMIDVEERRYAEVYEPDGWEAVA